MSRKRKQQPDSARAFRLQGHILPPLDSTGAVVMPFEAPRFEANEKTPLQRRWQAAQDKDGQ